jgi:hypothetical protein
MRILGIRVWPESLSDEEYVARIRKGLHVVRWLRWLNAALGIALVVGVIWGLTFFIRVLTMGQEHQDQPLIMSAFGAAISMGMAVGLWIAQAVDTIVNTLLGYRRDKLLVECWDALHRVQKT